MVDLNVMQASFQISMPVKGITFSLLAQNPIFKRMYRAQVKLLTSEQILQHFTIINKHIFHLRLHARRISTADPN